MSCNVLIGNGAGVVIASGTTAGDGDARSVGYEVRMLGLPKPHAIGVVHMGGACLYGVTVTSYLEEWMAHLGDHPFDYVSDYADSFREFMKEAFNRIPEGTRQTEYLESWRSWLLKVRSDLEKETDLTPDAIAAYFEFRAQRFLSGERATDKKVSNKAYRALGQGSKHNKYEKACKNHECQDMRHASIEGVIEQVFGDVLDDRARKAINEWARQWLGAYHPNEQGAEIHFVGYGSRTVYPVETSIAVDGSVFGHFFREGVKVTKAMILPDTSDRLLFRILGESLATRRFVQELGTDFLLDRDVVDAAIQERAEAFIENTRDHDGFDKEEALLKASLGGLNRERFEELIVALSGMNLSALASLSAQLVGIEGKVSDLRGSGSVPRQNVSVAMITKAAGFRLLVSPDISTPDPILSV